MNQPAPEPAPGSLQYFVLLYTPRPHRAALATLCAVAEELRTGVAHRLEHSVAHVRLEWWREEARRLARGEPQHPWLQALLSRQPERMPELGPLVEAAALDLAEVTLARGPANSLQAALFAGGARLLSPLPLPSDSLQALADLGATLASLAPAMPAASPAHAVAASIAEAERHLARLDPAAQPALAPLLIWSALTVRRARRRLRTADAGRFEALADNWLAWKSARRAGRRRFRLH